MKAILSNNRGVALIITILMISIIVVLTLEFNRSMRTEYQGAVNSRDNIMLGYIAKSGYNLALALLREDDPAFDSLNDDWALLKENSYLSEALFSDSGRFQVDITDLSGKIQINSLVKPDGRTYNEDQKNMLLRLLTSDLFNLEEVEARDILDNIKDWIDSDDEPTGNGSEDFDYQSLDNPYPCRNGKLRSIYEMIQIKGVSKELFFGTDETPGLKEFLTVYGNGPININTADRNILMVLSDELDEQMIDEIIAYRRDEDNDIDTLLWYKDALGTNEDIIPASLLTIKSSYFEILSRGLRDSAVKELKAVVKRMGSNFSTLSWEII